MGKCNRSQPAAVRSSRRPYAILSGSPPGCPGDQKRITSRTLGPSTGPPQHQQCLTWPLGILLKPLGGLLGLLGGHLRASWAPLHTAWLRLARSSVALGDSGWPFGAVLGPLGCFSEASCAGGRFTRSDFILKILAS